MKMKHFDHDGRARFVTFSTHRRLPILTNDVFRQDVVDALIETREKTKVRLVAYVIMPEHVHLVLVPPESTKIGSLIGDIKRLAARSVLARLRNNDTGLLKELVVERNRIVRHALWQRRCYDHNVRSEEFLWSKVLYCHKNPVTRELVKRPEDWPWSSYRWYQGETDVPLEMDLIAASV